jgi:hypothetical protein
VSAVLELSRPLSEHDAARHRLASLADEAAGVAGDLGSSSATAEAPSPLAAKAGAAGAAAPHPARFHVRRSNGLRTLPSATRLVETVKRPTIIAAACLLALVVAGGLLFAKPRGVDQKYWQAIDAISGRAHELARTRPSEAAWAAAVSEDRKQLEAIIGELKRTASAAEPARQNMLWAARDYLLPWLKLGSPIQDGDARFQEQMQAAQKLIAQRHSVGWVDGAWVKR